MVSYDSARLEWAKTRRIELDTLISSLEKRVDEEENPNNIGLRGTILNLGNLLADRFRLLDVFADAKTRVLLYRKALALGSDTQNAAGVSSRLAEALVDCYVRSGETDDTFLEEAITLCRQAVPSLEKDSYDYPVALCTLGSALRLRFCKFTNDEDLFEATTLFMTICGHEHASHPRYYYFVSQLGEAYKWDHFRTRELATLERAEEQHGRALDLCPREATDWLHITIAYTKTLNELAKATCSASPSLRGFDLLLELRNFYLALGQLPYCVLGCLCVTSAILADLMDNSQLLHTAMQYGQEGLASAEDVDKALAYRRIGDTSFDIYRGQGDISFATISINSFEKSLEIEGSSIRQRAITMVNLGATYGSRYEDCGHRKDLDMSIQLYREVLASPIPKTNFELFGIVSGNLSLSLVCRFDLTGDMDDLEESLHYAQKAESAFPPGQFQRPTSLSYLAGVLLRRYRYMHKRSDLEKAITTLNECVRLMDSEPPFRSDRLLSLSQAHILRYQDQGAEDEDIEKAIMFADKALTLRPKGHPRRHEVLKALSKAYSSRFIHRKTLQDYTLAIEYQTEAINISSYGSTYRAQALFGLARLYLLPEAPTIDTIAAIDLCTEALTDSNSIAYLCLQDTLEIQPLLESAARESHFSLHNRRQILDLYRNVLDLLPRVAYFGLDASSRLRVLNNAEHLATAAAAHAVILDEPEIAVEILEQGRGIFWSQGMKLRSQFSELPQDLQDRLSSAAYQLEKAACETSQDAASKEKSASEETDRKIRQLSDEFQALIKYVRTLPGHERFMLPLEFTTLKRATIHGPIVMFLASELVCCAIIIQNRSPAQVVRLTAVPSQLCKTMDEFLKGSSGRNVELDNACTEVPESGCHVGLEGPLRLTIGRSKSEYSKSVMDSLLEKLWLSVMEPVVKALNMQSSFGQNRPRIWLCPSGAFALLPLHAAGIQKRGGLGFSSYFVSSYTPTISDLLRVHESFKAISRNDVRVLLAEVPVPFKGTRLLEVAHEMELVRGIIPEAHILATDSDSGSENASQGGSTINMVLNRISDASIFHIATHGIHDQNNALYSGFAMQDGMLTLSKLMSLNLPNGFLAILSACDTAKGDSSHPDQALHLAAAMLFVGFRSVIGTMWSMHDTDGPSLSKEIYRQLFREHLSDGFDADDVAYALDNAVETLKQSGAPASRWAPFVHMGI